MKSSTIITRFPPSPTGNLHIGSARTALFNYVFAKQTCGKMYLRLENTDEERSKPEHEKNILDSLEWLGLSFDTLPDGKPFWRQSERREIYRGYLKKLVGSGKVYVSNETDSDSPFLKGSTEHFSESARGGISKSSGLADSATSFRKGGMKRSEVIRFKNPNRKIAFTDLIRGTISFDTTELGDVVIAKSIEEPLYHLAVVIDDHEMGITHVIRGEDHISNTPRQILLQEALGFPRPLYAHIPLILAPDRSKLSKRHGAVSVTEYRDKGYLPEAVVNYLALLGWNPGTDREIFSLDELVRDFDLSKVQKGGAVFNEEKLRWFNKEYLKMRGGAEIVIPHIPESLSKGRTEIQMNALAEMLFERVSVFGDIQTEVGRGEFDYLIKSPLLDAEKISWKDERNPTKTAAQLQRAIELLREISENSFAREQIHSALWNAEKEKKGRILWPVRYALSGREKSPDPFTLAAILGKEETLARLNTALGMLR